MAFNSSFTTLTQSEADIFTATNKSLILLVQAVNISLSETTCQLWITDGSNNHVASLIPQQDINPSDGISDTSKHVLPVGYKIRGFAGADTAVMVEISAMDVA